MTAKASGQLEPGKHTDAAFLIGFISLLFLVSWCLGGSPHGVQADSTPSFDSQVAPILQKNCLACHSSASKMGGLVMESYDGLMKGGAHGPAIIPGKADQSRMILMLEGRVQPRMPFGADPLPAADIAALEAWVEGGAPGPAPGEAATALAPLAIPDIKPQVAVVSPVASVKFSPDGKLLAVGGYQEVRLIDLAKGKPLATLAGHADYVRSLAFSPDGKMLAAAGGPPQRSGEIKSPRGTEYEYESCSVIGGDTPGCDLGIVLRGATARRSR